MLAFRYVAKDKTGKTVRGSLEAPTREALIDSLRKRDLIIISIAKETPRAGVSFAFGGGVKLDDLVIFSRQLATMVDAGIPLVQALDILCEQMEKRSFKAILTKIKDDVETGSSLSDAMARHPRVFTELFSSMVRAGENSGMLDEILDRLAGYLEKTNNLIKKVRASLVYPIVVMIMAFLITAILIIKVIPAFKGIFLALGGTLPLPTRILIAVSDFARQMFLGVIGALVLGGFGISWFINKTEKGRLLFDKLTLKLPIFGVLLRKVAISKFTRTLATLVRSGVPILSSLDIVAKTAGNKVVENAVIQARTNIREGESIAEPLARLGVFPPMVVRMIAVGEQTGELEKMLTKISDFYDEQVDIAVSSLTSLIEPVIIVFLGIIVGGIVISMFLPIFKLTQLVAH